VRRVGKSRGGDADQSRAFLQRGGSDLASDGAEICVDLARLPRTTPTEIAVMARRGRGASENIRGPPRIRRRPSISPISIMGRIPFRLVSAARPRLREQDLSRAGLSRRCARPDEFGGETIEKAVEFARGRGVRHRRPLPGGCW